MKQFLSIYKIDLAILFGFGETNTPRIPSAHATEEKSEA
jgi:hypothetical protein